jgi:hypothetical protein
MKKLRLCRNPSLNTLSAIARVTPPLPQRGRQPKWVSPLTPNLNLFFRYMFTAMLYGARVDRPSSARGSITIQY